jgi:ATP-dependent DNA ligase
MMRNYHGPYESDKHSYHLVKVKAFKEEEFRIIGVSEGRGKFAGKAIFTCEVGFDPIKTFECCAPGTMKDREDFFRRAPELIGKAYLTVKYFEWTDDGIPLHGTGEAVRSDYE